MKAFKPSVRTDSSFSLIRARHPLIDPKKCVPVDIASVSYTHLKNINGCHRDIGVENDVTMLVEFANGATGTFTTCTHDAIGTDRLEIDLDGGKIVVDNSKMCIRDSGSPG